MLDRGQKLQTGKLKLFIAKNRWDMVYERYKNVLNSLILFLTLTILIYTTNFMHIHLDWKTAAAFQRHSYVRVAQNKFCKISIQSLIFFRRHVDDIITIVPYDKSDELLQTFKNIHPKFQFCVVKPTSI